MSNFIVSGIQTAGSSLVQTASQLALNYASSSISNLFDNRVFEGPRLKDFHLLTSRDGAPMAKVYGRMRLAGSVIWASRLKEHVTEERVGGKGGPRQRNYSYTMSFAIGLCEGVIQSVDRIWVNGQILPLSGLNIRVYKGTEDQLPDPIISAIESVEAPAFRGTAYIVFEDFPLDDYGARLPQFNVEVRALPETYFDEARLEDLVTGVCLLPSSGEYAYATNIVEDVTGPGQAQPINMNNISGDADIIRAIDQLENQLPNCRNVSIIVSWFGTDLRVGHCEIKPGVESDDRIIPDYIWQVSGDIRGTAYQVSTDPDGRPNFGGTPSDRSIIQTIQILKSRGFSVTIYPFILMDVPPENGLPDPYGGAEQAAFPWRGRITSSNDLSASVTSEIDSFFGQADIGDFQNDAGLPIYTGIEEYSFRRFILHYAKLAELAGGVDRFIIGSEMRGLTTLRDGDGHYPAVDKCVDLAADVRAILGATTQLTYAADWSEYFGHHPQDDSGDVFYHLDPLWASPNIDAVGIDAYFPLSDWREGAHLDESFVDNIYDQDYLASNIEGGEGYDWYYANADDRDAQSRSPISDPIFRYKDMRHWWSQPHFNRAGGVAEASPTSWIPESKPIWFTELGCPAIDKGANQPNVFVDPKSSESHIPYQSSGSRDDLIQRRYIEAMLSYWPENNPVSSSTGQPMIDMEASHIWCWDARPFPDFPARADVWNDGPNWQLGHWLTGRVGLVPLRDVIADICVRCGITEFDVSQVFGLIEGYVLDRPLSGRAALTPLLNLFQIDAIECADGLTLVSKQAHRSQSLTLEDMVETDRPLYAITTEDPETRPLDVRLTFIDSARDFQPGSVSARNQDAETVRVLDLTAPIVMGEALARQMANHWLEVASSLTRRLSFTLSPARLDLDVGDIIELPDLEGHWQIERQSGIFTHQISAKQIYGADVVEALNGHDPVSLPPLPWVSEPAIFVLDIPDYSGRGTRQGPLVGAMVSPFNPVTISGPDGDSVTVDVPVAIGAVLTELPAGPVGRWDNSNTVEVLISGVDLAAVEEVDLFSGANSFAVETETGWEILQAQNIELIGQDSYKLSKLLRGVFGTDADMMDAIPAGARITYLNRGWTDLSLSISHIGEEIDLIGEAAGRLSDRVTHEYAARHLRPLSPVHGKVETLPSGDVEINWIRRSRIEGDSWAGLDVPLGKESEKYTVSFLQNQTEIAVYETDRTHLLLDQTQLTELSQATHIQIRQVSSVFGLGAPFNIAH